MEVSRIRALRGPNLWSRRTAVEAIVACNRPGSGVLPTSLARGKAAETQEKANGLHEDAEATPPQA